MEAQPKVQNGDESAFPTDGVVRGDLGLTKREYFAGLAMQGRLSNKHSGFTDETFTAMKVAKFSLLCADALLEELSKK